MNTSHERDTATPDGAASIASYIVSLAGTYAARIRVRQHTAYGSCSDCRPAWTALGSGFVVLDTLLRVMEENHAAHSPTPTDTDGTDND